MHASTAVVHGAAAAQGRSPLTNGASAQATLWVLDVSR